MKVNLSLEDMITLSECLDIRLRISNVVEPDSDLSRIEDLKTLIDASISAEKERIKYWLAEMNEINDLTRN